MKIEIPSYRTLTIETIVMDFNGTIAVDGILKEGLRDRIVRLTENFRVYVITSDTQGTAEKELAGLPIVLKIFDHPDAGAYKRRIVEDLGADRCACVGNGNNDRPMFEAAALSIAVLETEGLYGPLLSQTDLLVKSSEDALDLLLDPTRIISGLRG